MSRIAFLFLAFLLGVAAARLPWPSVYAAPPGSQTTFVISSQADKDYLFDHELQANILSRYAAQVAAEQVKLTDLTAKRDALGSRARSGLVKHKPMMEDLLPAATYRFVIGWADANGNGKRDTGENDAVRLFVNGDADGVLADPPVGLPVGVVVKK